MMNINIYTLTVDFNAPKFESPHNTLKLKAGHRLISIDDNVYVKTVKVQDNLSDDTYIKVLLTSAFVKINPIIFKKI